MELTANEQLNQFIHEIKDVLSVYRRHMNTLGISENEFWIWYTLIEMDGPFSQQDICNMWAMSKQTVNSIITSLVKKDLLVLKVDPGKKTRKIIELTEKGKAYGEKFILPLWQLEKKAFEQLSEEEKQTSIQTLSHFHDLLQQQFDLHFKEGEI